MMLFDPFAPFDQFLPRTGGRVGFLPATDVVVGEGDMVLTMDLPGLTTDDLHIEVLDGALTIKGERKRPELPENARWGHAERTFGSFERRVNLPDGVDPERIMASMDNGVLSLIVPKPERMKPRTVQITAGDKRELTSTTA